jgi:glycosyltransferase involved in cell wall biosynthesis
MIKILHTVESYDPVTHGMQQVVKQISERLVQMGHDVTIATGHHPNRDEFLINGVKIVQFKISGKYVGGFIGENVEIQRYRDFLIDSDFDVVTNFAAQHWATDIALPILKKIKAIKIFVPTGFSEFNNPKFKKYYNLMETWMHDYNAHIFLSDKYQDIDFARKIGVKNINVIPNGASAEEFEVEYAINIREHLGIPKNHFLILHVGSHTGLKGHKEAIKIFQRAKIKNATLLMIGNSTFQGSKAKHCIKNIIKYLGNIFSRITKKKFYPSTLFYCKIKSILHKISYGRMFENKMILVKDLTRNQTVACYKEANLFLFPSNIECSPLVLFECMASQTFFLATDVGNVKEIISWSNSGKLLPTIDYKNGIKSADIVESAKILEQLFIEKNSINKSSLDGFHAFTKKFTWKIITEQYLMLYQKFIMNA